MPQMSWLARQDGYDPNAFDVPLDQGTNVGWANRMGEILTTRPTYDEQTVLHSTASPLVNITEGDIGRATEAAMGVSGGGMTVKGQPGIRAYHSSPHDFDKFDLSKIGTGEGAQVYGHGLYFAESPAVSGQGGQYWNQFANKFRGPESTAANILKLNNFDRPAAIEQARRMIAKEEEALRAGRYVPDDPRTAMDADQMSWHPELIDKHKQVLSMLEGNQIVGPRTYEVNINADPAHMLDWDKPLSAQPHATKTIMDLLPAAERRRIERWEKPNWSEGDPKASYFDTVKGGTEYQGLAGILGKSDAASAALREAGIPGIKYLDQGSRISSPTQIGLIRQNIADREALLAKNPGNPTDTKWLAEYQDMLKRAENPTSNYVIFDPNIIDIMKKYVVPGAIGAGGMGALAAQDEYRGAY